MLYSYRINLKECKYKQKVAICRKCVEKHEENINFDNVVVKCILIVFEYLSILKERGRYVSIMGTNRFEILSDEGINRTFPAIKRKRQPQTSINNKTAEAG